MDKFAAYIEIKKFIAYIFTCYGPKGEFVKFFGDSLTVGEVEIAVKKRLELTQIEFDGDSFDRELVRDILFIMRDRANEVENIKLKDWVTK